jgi:ribosomal protein S21
MIGIKVKKNEGVSHNRLRVSVAKQKIFAEVERRR